MMKIVYATTLDIVTDRSQAFYTCEYCQGAKLLLAVQEQAKEYLEIIVIICDEFQAWLTLMKQTGSPKHKPR